MGKYRTFDLGNYTQEYNICNKVFIFHNYLFYLFPVPYK